jgi:iron(III) transport system substrate-binding protein
MNHMPRKNLVNFLCVLLVTALGTTACGQETSKKTAETNYEALSMQDLEAGAKKEGKLVWYGAMVGDELGTIAKKFTEKYGIPVEYIVMDSTVMPSRVMTEQKGGKFNADVISASGWPMDQIKRSKALEKYISPETKALDKGTVDPEGYWAAHFSLTYPIVYNTQKLKELGLKPPTSYEDLTKPEWQGHFSVHRADYEWYSSMMKSLGEKGKQLTEDLAKNKPQVREGHPVLLQGVINGEYAASISAFGYKADQQKAKGEPVDYVNVNPTIAVLQPIGIAKNAPHPYAARLFQTWLLSADGQKFIFDSFGRTPTRKDVGKGSNVYDPSRFNYYYSAPESGAEYENIAKEFKKVFGIGG